MTYHNAAKRILTAPRGSDPRSADRLSLLCRFFDLPLKGMVFIKLFGQSGKSACAEMLSRILVSNGFRVGMVTTPFAHSITECVMANGQTASMEQFTASVEATLAAVTSIREAMAALAESAEEDNNESLSPFERSLLAYAAGKKEFSLFSDELLLISALRIFAEERCHIVILEVPSDERAGAYRLPVAPTVSVITSTEDERVAARICRTLDRNTPEVVTALQDKQIYSMIAGACADINCRLSMPLRNAYYPSGLSVNRMRFFYRSVEHTLNSGAEYQAFNLLTVSETLEALNRHGISAKNGCVNLSLDTTATPKTHFSFLAVRPTIVMDGADTPSRIEAFARSLRAHTELLGTQVTVIAERDSLSDRDFAEKFAAEGFSVTETVRADLTTARRELKPRVKALTQDSTWVILGSRSFIYEISRIIRGLLAT